MKSILFSSLVISAVMEAVVLFSGSTAAADAQCSFERLELAAVRAAESAGKSLVATDADGYAAIEVSGQSSGQIAISCELGIRFIVKLRNGKSCDGYVGIPDVVGGVIVTAPKGTKGSGIDARIFYCR